MDAILLVMLVVVLIIIAFLSGAGITLYWTSNFIRDNYQAKINHERD